MIRTQPKKPQFGPRKLFYTRQYRSYNPSRAPPAPDEDGKTAQLLVRLRAGDPSALNALIAHTEERLRRLARQMLRGFPKVGRWEQTDDVLQNALARLCKTVRAEAPENARHYYNLATRHIRRELLDLAHRYYGPQGLGANRHAEGTNAALAGAVARSEEPSSAAEWAEFHQRVDTLPEEDREVFGLLWYEGLTQEEAAEILGVSVRTVKRRWQSARLALARSLGGHPHTS